MKEEILELGKLKINYKEFEAIKTDFSNDEDSSFADIIILHWWWWKSDSWIEVWKMLSEKWFRVIIPDLPWFWKTEITKVYNLWDYAQVIEEFCKKLNLEDIILWGHSNWWAISITIENRKKIDIDRLVLNNSAGIRNDKKRTKKRQILKLVIDNLKFLKKIFIFKKIRILFYKIIWWQDYLNSEKNPYLKQTYLNMISSDLQEKIKNIELDTLIIWWELDTYTPLNDWSFMRNNIKSSKMVVLDNETHWIHIKNPYRLVETFLKNI
jgi:pimeloyl-ACP methyl ester carboxylesterase